jgi:hypothetical protein
LVGDVVPHGERQKEEDSKARKSQMDRECYAKMSRKKKDERSRKYCVRRVKKKGRAIGKKLHQLYCLVK